MLRCGRTIPQLSTPGADKRASAPKADRGLILPGARSAHPRGRKSSSKRRGQPDMTQLNRPMYPRCPRINCNSQRLPKRSSANDRDSRHGCRRTCSTPSEHTCRHLKSPCGGWQYHYHQHRSAIDPRTELRTQRALWRGTRATCLQSVFVVLKIA